MATYTVAASVTAPAGADPTAFGGFEYASGGPGCAVLQAYLADVENTTFAHRWWVAISTGTSGAVNQTPERLQANSRASDATGLQGAHSVTRGRTALVAGFNNTTALFGVQRAWHPARTRYPFICNASERVGQMNQSNGQPHAFTTIVTEPWECPARPLHRRQRTRGGDLWADFASGKRGATASPTVRHLANGGGLQLLEMDDWRVVARPVSAALQDTGGGPTTYFLDVGGTLTTAGALTRQPRRLLSGTLSTAGTLIWQVQRLLAGMLTTAGGLTNTIIRALSVSGTLTTGGELVRQTQRALSGTLTTAGVVSRETQRVFAGALSLAGALTTAVVKVLNVAGTLTTSGALSNVFQAGSAVAATVRGLLRYWSPRR